jgi:hypothetical protein
MASILSSSALTTATVAAAQISGANATTDQALLERLINAASAAIEAYCCRKFAKTTGYVETLELPAGSHLLLSLLPVASISTIKIDGDTITGYTLDDASAGIVHLDGGWYRDDYSDIIEYGIDKSESPSGAVLFGTTRRVCVATYTGGYVLPKDVSAGPPAVVQTLPDDLEQACVMTVASLWRRRGSDVAAAEYNGTNTAMGRGRGGIIPDAVASQLDAYRRRVF